MSWKRHVTVVSKDKRLAAVLANNARYNSGGYDSDIVSTYNSYLAEYYAGNPQRITRYRDYDTMDMDSEINTSLDIIADFCTQNEENNKVPFEIEFHSNPTDTEVTIINETLLKWCRLNKFNKRLWSIFRSAIKYGDCFFVRDPETFEWLWVDQSKVRAVVVNAAEGKVPSYYVVDDIDFRINEQVLVPKTLNGNNMSTSTSKGPSMPDATSISSASAQGTTFNISADSLIHLSLTDGIDKNWPFGNSILESVFKVFKQKELIEDAILIYRIQRAPERRIFYIDTGEMNPKEANAYVQRIKNEVHQKRIPNRSNGTNITDAAYNPLSIMEDYFFAQSSDGRSSRVDTLPGGDGISNINDLEFFDNKLKRGLGIPPSYLPTSDEGAGYNDGKVGTAYMQEYRFSKYCQRLQNTIIDPFDRDFKLYLKKKGLNIDTSLFDLKFHDPQSFSKYRQIDIDTAQISVFSSVIDVPFISKRYALKRYLNWSEDEIAENELMWREENKGKLKSSDISGISGGVGDIGLDSVGIRPPSDSELADDDFGDFGMDDIGGDVGTPPNPADLGGGGDAAAGGEPPAF